MRGMHDQGMVLGGAPVVANCRQCGADRGRYQYCINCGNDAHDAFAAPKAQLVAGQVAALVAQSAGMRSRPGVALGLGVPEDVASVGTLQDERRRTLRTRSGWLFLAVLVVLAIAVFAR